MKIVVVNNRESLVQGQKQPQITNLQGAPVIAGVVTFLPGANLVDKADLEHLRKNPTFELNFTTAIPKSPALEQNPEKVGLPILAVMEVAGGKDGAKIPLELEDRLPLQKLKPEVAKKLIGETLVAGILRGWEREEARPEVRYEIQLQIDAVEGKPAGPASVGR